MRENPESISAIVVHWNQPLACAATVDALRAQAVPVNVTVLDNCSEPAAVGELERAIGNGASVVRLPENLGWGPALNVGLRTWLDSADTRYCVISAHDAEIAPDCLQLLVGTMQSDPRIGVACPQYPDGTLPKLTALHGVKLHVGQQRETGKPQLVDVPHGTLMVVARECLRDIGLFDGRYFAYGDEHELGARAVRRGWKVVMVWGACVSNPTTSTPSAWRSYLFARNSLLLVHDYRGWFAAVLRALVLICNTIRMLIGDRHSSTTKASARARIDGVRDFFRGRFGPPRLPARATQS